MIYCNLLDGELPACCIRGRGWVANVNQAEILTTLRTMVSSAKVLETPLLQPTCTVFIATGYQRALLVFGSGWNERKLEEKKCIK
ncbi:unnamed protein product [Nezara viridula]|uniref:Uncharacterized protein n=1 Tax=Nezara viridula TaxID=85310 RepID=A0A9P0MNZ7_NEZVI|nr:unnamed protein product [Nezara viridula]